jgi:hypothetical protein
LRVEANKYFVEVLENMPIGYQIEFGRHARYHSSADVGFFCGIAIE